MDREYFCNVKRPGTCKCDCLGPFKTREEAAGAGFKHNPKAREVQTGYGHHGLFDMQWHRCWQTRLPAR